MSAQIAMTMALPLKLHGNVRLRAGDARHPHSEQQKQHGGACQRPGRGIMHRRGFIPPLADDRLAGCVRGPANLAPCRALIAKERGVEISPLPISWCHATLPQRRE
jgi:hypothetical protein